VILQICVDLLTVVPSACCETCLPSSDDGNEVFNIKFEDVSVKEEEVPLPSVAAKAEEEVSVLFVCLMLDTFHIHLELPVDLLNSLCILTT
jgi:hypothetical protein